MNGWSTAGSLVDTTLETNNHQQRPLQRRGSVLRLFGPLESSGGCRAHEEMSVHACKAATESESGVY